MVDSVAYLGYKLSPYIVYISKEQLPASADKT